MPKHRSTATARPQRDQTAADVTTERLNNMAVPNGHTYTLDRHGRHWEVRDATGTLVCLTVYKRGAAEVIRRLSS